VKIYTLSTFQMTDRIGEYIPVESHCFEYPDNLSIERCDRSAQNQSSQNSNKANSVAGGFGTTAGQIGSSIIPGLESEAKNPTGFTPEQKNNMLTAGAEAIGGVNSGLKGAAALDTARTRNAGGLAPALDEAARIKSRQLGTNALGVENENANLEQSKQKFAQQQLGGLYQGLNSDQLKAMGLSDEDINTMIKAGQSGWQQNAMGWIGAGDKASQGLGAAFGT
jgi:hypothetical protein